MRSIPLFLANMILACLAAPVPAASPGAPPANARNDAWEVIGPGGGGAMIHPTISLHDPNVVLVGCDMTGAYLTKDGGKSWRMINLRGVAQFFVFDPSDANTLYVQTLGLWRSTDAGVTWALVYPNPKAVTGIDLSDDEADEGLQTSWNEGGITALAVDPQNSQALYAVFLDQGHLWLRRSPDGGRKWKPLNALMPEGTQHIYIDPESPAGQRTVYAVGSKRVAVVEGGKLRAGAEASESFVDVSAGFPGQGARPVIYGVSENALYVSRDGGATWARKSPGGSLRAVAASLFHPEVAYVSFGGKPQPLPGSFGVAKTEDFGVTWRDVWSETTEKKSPSVDDGWLSERFGPDWGENPLGLGVSPAKPEICYGADLGRTLRSLDGGATWTAAYTRRVPGGAWTTTGLDVTTNYGVHFDPFDPRHVFIDYTDIGLFSSNDGGASWESATGKGVPREWRNTTYWLVFDPAVRGRIWAVMSGTHDLPRNKMWRSPVASFTGGVVRSDDGGRTWRAMTNGLPQTATTHILLDARSTPEARVLYVAGFGRGVFRSRDGGQSWEAMNNGLPTYEPFAWRLAQDRNGVLYVVLIRRTRGGDIGTDRDGALYRSRNQGESWERVPLPAGVNGPNGLSIDPEDPGRLYLAAWKRNVGGEKATGGIYLSTDAGATWQPVLSYDQYIYDVSIDPRDKMLLYAAGFQSSAWRSTDRGLSWKRIRGYNFKWGHRVIPDPRDASKIYITTFGGSVWHGPAVGDPYAAEDIVTPAVAYSK